MTVATLDRPAGQGVWLDTLLAPVAPFLAQPDITDIWINRAGEIWVERIGGTIERHEVAALTAPVLQRLARQIAAHSAQGISRAHPLLAASLPDGSRVQVVAPPATRGELAFAIRRHVKSSRSLADYGADGAFEGLDAAGHAATGAKPATLRPIPADQAQDFLARAVCERKNILVSGGTSSGKTTFLNALLREIPAGERLILIEDTPELQVSHENTVGLLTARSEIAESDVTAEDLLIAALRMRPDRIILGELRGREAFTFLRSVNTGHPGSMTTIHADSPQRAVEQLALLVLQSGTRLRREDVVSYVEASVDVFVQLERVGGRRQVGALLAR